MNSEEKLNIIRDRLQDEYSPSFLNVIDESEKHKGHPGHQGGGRHFAIEICAPSLTELTRVSAHQKIYSLLSDMMATEIHALRIKILHAGK